MHKCNQSPIISVKKREREYFQFKSSPQVTKYRFSHTRFSKISSHPKSVRSENNWKEVFENILFLKKKSTKWFIVHQIKQRAHQKKSKRNFKHQLWNISPSSFRKQKVQKVRHRAFSPNQSKNIDKWELYRNPGVWQ